MSIGRAFSNLPRSVKLSACLLVLLAALPAVYVVFEGNRVPPSYPSEMPRSFSGRHFISSSGKGVLPWWERVPPQFETRLRAVSASSNIHPDDYIGPQACAKCHHENYDSWFDHPHRRMNAVAGAESVLGDFSGQANIEYLGGLATFSLRGGEYRMRLERDGVVHVYKVTQTIGSRFFQYYVGSLIDGPERDDHPLRKDQHVLPFGYWLDRQMWVPIVHVGEELPDGDRGDPFEVDVEANSYSVYAESCNSCHTTFPLADMFSRNPQLMARHVPRKLHWHVEPYLRAAHSEVWPGDRDPWEVDDDELFSMFSQARYFDASKKGVTQGISCEACHLGCKEHAAGKKKKPDFFPRSPHLYYEIFQGEPATGRTRDNVNWACGRCHIGDRPQFANGTSTWNSTEYSDAMKGSCYTKLTCIECHSPHEGIGKQWPHPPEFDDGRCLKCHEKYEPAQARTAHTHHAPGSSGSRCMNCHMPRLNEGLQDVVRTHTIFSPGDPKMIENNHPNACNLCHTDRPIDWTLDALSRWYGKSYSEDAVAAAYPDRTIPAAIGWLKGGNESVRLVAADALTRNKDRWALSALIDALDDPYLLNRQFADRGLQTRLDIDAGQYGYRFYMSPEERQEPLEKLREALLGEGDDDRGLRKDGDASNPGLLPE